MHILPRLTLAAGAMLAAAAPGHAAEATPRRGIEIVEPAPLTGAGLRPGAAPRLGLSWSFDLGDAGGPLFSGRAGQTLLLGTDGFGYRARPESWIEASLMWELGSTPARHKQVYGGLGFRYIHNKFGAAPGGGQVATPLLKLEARF